MSATEQLIEDALAGSTTMRGDGRFVTLRILGTTAVLRYRLDEHEDRRRRRAGLGAVTRPDVLDLLLGLPIGMPVPTSSLSPVELSTLRATPVGAVTVATGSVVREAVQPLAVDLAVVAVRRWQAGLEVAGRFAPFCARMMLLDCPPRDVDDLRAQADFWGIGVMIAGTGGVDMQVAPGPYRRQRFTAAGWQFVEKVYQRVARPVGAAS